MLSHPETADGQPADVYSLAKTLWVLATGQNYPPPGEQRTDIEQIAINTYFSHPRAGLLDKIGQEATRYNPNARPLMSQLAKEFRAWP